MAVISTGRVREQRAREVQNALASVRMEGLEPSKETATLFQRYVDGELTSEEFDHAYVAYLDDEFGPVCLPGNERS